MKSLSTNNFQHFQNGMACSEVHPISRLKDWRLFCLNSMRWKLYKGKHEKYPSIELGFGNTLVRVQNIPKQSATQHTQNTISQLTQPIFGKEEDKEDVMDLSTVLVFGYDKTLHLFTNKYTNKRPGTVSECYIEKPKNQLSKLEKLVIPPRYPNPWKT